MADFQYYQFFNDKTEQMSTTDVLDDISHLKYRCYSYTFIIITCVIVLALFIFIVIGGLVYKNRWKFRYFMYRTRNTFFGHRNTAYYTAIKNYQFDAFISYAEDNTRFILDDVIPRLETENVSLCLHQRDFLPGNAISDNIILAIQSSRKTVVILSNAFLKSKWCLYEFNMARMDSIYSRGEDISLVLVMLETVPDSAMPLEMLRWIQDNNYIEYTTDHEGNALFWDKLKSVITQ
ncbi:hypothetical protein DPMN_017889 [Dreissena polymorpha]|uniref:TIR domain-containing protein n=1 Tax=Dreissena polymorpha TaxID=45954 RepID=A0A9D4NHE5_DREPO|nr:hypothetical protein DPMN_017889 [Dreissena polymorpha]